MVDYGIKSKTLRAFKFADDKHKEAFRKNGHTPYISHPQDVVDTLLKWGIKQDDVIAAAYLHDTVEDTNTTVSEIHNEFGPTVALLVEELTYDPKYSDMTKGEYLGTFAHTEIGSLAIKLADRFCNTVDFANANDSYAPKYWKKAAVLFEIMRERKQELEATFGEAAYKNMETDIVRLSQELAV